MTLMITNMLGPYTCFRRPRVPCMLRPPLPIPSTSPPSTRYTFVNAKDQRLLTLHTSPFSCAASSQATLRGHRVSWNATVQARRHRRLSASLLLQIVTYNTSPHMCLLGMMQAWQNWSRARFVVLAGEVHSSQIQSFPCYRWFEFLETAYR